MKTKYDGNVIINYQNQVVCKGEITSNPFSLSKLPELAGYEISLPHNVTRDIVSVFNTWESLEGIWESDNVITLIVTPSSNYGFDLKFTNENGELLNLSKVFEVYDLKDIEINISRSGITIALYDTHAWCAAYTSNIPINLKLY